MTKTAFKDSSGPLGVDELMEFFRQRWGVSYDMQLVARSKRLYLQVMWAFLEQQSFPLSEEAYRGHISEVLDVVNRLGLSSQVRDWLYTTSKRPRLGKALSLPLKSDQGLDEFLL